MHDALCFWYGMFMVYGMFSTTKFSPMLSTTAVNHSLPGVPPSPSLHVLFSHIRTWCNMLRQVRPVLFIFHRQTRSSDSDVCLFLLAKLLTLAQWTRCKFHLMKPCGNTTYIDIFEYAFPGVWINRPQRNVEPAIFSRYFCFEVDPVTWTIKIEMLPICLYLKNTRTRIGHCAEQTTGRWVNFIGSYEIILKFIFYNG